MKRQANEAYKAAKKAGKKIVSFGSTGYLSNETVYVLITK